MKTKTITGAVTDERGNSIPFSGTINVEELMVTSLTVTPDPAPPGKLRVINITVANPQNKSLTYTCQVDGTDATPVDGRPGQFTITI
ncbi:MAG: hypothetical protein LUO93_10960 [Methanomicrobiales archaeon]|nr:hypothetical protein [Methanomicrobiales archaeon]